MTRTNVTVSSSKLYGLNRKKFKKLISMAQVIFFLMSSMNLQVKMMVENIGFPNYIVDDKLIDEEYKNVSEK